MVCYDLHCLRFTIEVAHLRKQEHLMAVPTVVVIFRKYSMAKVYALMVTKRVEVCFKEVSTGAYANIEVDCNDEFRHQIWFLCRRQTFATIASGVGETGKAGLP